MDSSEKGRNKQAVQKFQGQGTKKFKPATSWDICKYLDFYGEPAIGKFSTV
jgi:hypothetical protein